MAVIPTRLTVRHPTAPIAVDTGFIVYNTATYPNLMALFDYLNVPTTPSLMGFGVSLDGGDCEYSGDTLLQMMGNPGNLVVPGHWRMLWDIVRFFRTAEAQSKHLDEGVTLGQFLKAQGYSRAFMERHLLPMAGAIWSSSPNQMLDYPAVSFLRFLGNHGLLQYNDRPQWRTVTGGSREYVERLVADGRFRILTGCPVRRVERSAAGVVVEDGLGFRDRFDHVVMATHADQALAMLKDPSPEERQCLVSLSLWAQPGGASPGCQAYAAPPAPVVKLELHGGEGRAGPVLLHHLLDECPAATGDVDGYFRQPQSAA